ncbi:dihydropteroate synthase [Phaeobacter gallaeciensis]|uniref:dihydropteroate synthase n=1 Tax=Phaeobacter gallaeciensis TaxID=60890 RepID=UPI00237F93A9|nr:dihydropteroate synthase [Phaeobacter gallaeciensis]MDE4190724.1 dihydropteroate synthase [Phaeobacter gallaeciensis]MDE4197783.1 dihydropteroate synthase [Phaeobacter gallaeciensis]MDE4201925.1 dihydropteroate synthase [Phaeobacter gallaeciensis]MDE4206775.1 dihydropteroate synthase [Phaeobacter gallaeciensis]MDE4215143.1 dihydropteroate synthase [Phaeobacter gallaeciensis]
MMYYRPLVQHGDLRPEGAVPLAGGSSLWFSEAEVLSRDAPPRLIPAGLIPEDICHRLSGRRAAIAGLDMTQPQVMGILNVTPDSFSDGGRHSGVEAGCAAALRMVEEGASIIDVGGESTRPGADFIPEDEEIARTAPVIAAIREVSQVAISIDTRKAEVAAETLEAGAGLINDVSGFTFDAALAPLAAQAGVPVCVMHAQGDPATMQENPVYENVLLDVYDFLAAQVDRLEATGVLRDRIVIDPGIGFGKTQEHNLTLLRNLSLFHGLGCPILLGVSRKGFIGKIGQAPSPDARAPGSIAVGLAGLAQGVQILRVHDVAETAQAVRLWQAVR